MRPLNHAKRSVKKRAKTPRKDKAPPKSNQRLGPIVHHLQTWATELGKDPETIKKALIKADYMPQPGEPIPLKAIIAALFGEEHVAKVEGMKLDNQRKAREEAQANGVLVEWEAVRVRYNERAFKPMQSAFDAAPAETRPWIRDVLSPLVRKACELKANDK